MVTARWELLQYCHWIQVCVYIPLTPVAQPTNHCWIKAPQTLFYGQCLGAPHFLEKKIEIFYTGTQYLLWFNPNLKSSTLFPSTPMRQSCASPIFLLSSQPEPSLNPPFSSLSTIILYVHYYNLSCLLSLLSFFLDLHLKCLPFLRDAPVILPSFLFKSHLPSPCSRCLSCKLLVSVRTLEMLAYLLLVLFSVYIWVYWHSVYAVLGSYQFNSFSFFFHSIHREYFHVNKHFWNVIFNGFMDYLHQIPRCIKAFIYSWSCRYSIFFFFFSSSK